MDPQQRQGQGQGQAQQRQQLQGVMGGQGRSRQGENHLRAAGAMDGSVPPTPTPSYASPVVASKKKNDYPVTCEAMRLHKDHPLRMRLEWDEIHRAEEIKDAIENTAGLDNLSDFWYVHYALICKDQEGNVLLEDVMERAEALQVFRNQYEIKETYEEGQRALRKLVALSPNLILSFFYDTQQGNYTLIEKTANMGAENFTAKDRKDFLIGYYYAMLASVPDFQTIHKGNNLRVDCKDMGWSKRHNMKIMHQAAKDFLSIVPYRQNSAQFFNTGVGGAVFNTMLKTIYKALAETYGEESYGEGEVEWTTECLTYLEGLDSILLTPDPATAQMKALYNLEEGLRLKFENQDKFRLAQENYSDICPITDDMVEAIFEARRGRT